LGSPLGPVPRFLQIFSKPNHIWGPHWTRFHFFCQFSRSRTTFGVPTGSGSTFSVLGFGVSTQKPREVIWDSGEIAPKRRSRTLKIRSKNTSVKPGLQTLKPKCFFFFRARLRQKTRKRRSRKKIAKNRYRVMFRLPGLQPFFSKPSHGAKNTKSTRKFSASRNDAVFSKPNMIFKLKKITRVRLHKMKQKTCSRNY